MKVGELKRRLGNISDEVNIELDTGENADFQHSHVGSEGTIVKFGAARPEGEEYHEAVVIHPDGMEP